MGVSYLHALPGKLAKRLARFENEEEWDRKILTSPPYPLQEPKTARTLPENAELGFSRASLHLAPRARLRRPLKLERVARAPGEDDVHPDVVAQEDAVEVDVDLVHRPEIPRAPSLRLDVGPVVVEYQ